MKEIRSKKRKQETDEALSVEQQRKMGAVTQEIQEDMASAQCALIPCR